MNKNAFTLVELIVAISIMSIVLVLAIPSIGAISERNAKKRYENYGETLVSSGKLYTDSNAIDMFGYESDGCFDIYFDALKEKKLAKDIDYKEVSCADGGEGKTYVKVRKLDGEIKYQLSMVCRDEKGEVVYDDLIDSSDILCDGRAPHTGPEVTISPEKQEAYLSEDETYKVSIKVHDDDGLLENNEVEYSWCKDASCTNVISTTRLRYENKRDADIKTVNKKIPRPKGDGVYYLKVRSVKVVDIFNNATTYEKIFGPYRFDTTPPKVTIKAYRRSAIGTAEGSEVATASIGARKVIKDKNSTSYLIAYKEGTIKYDTLKNLYNKKWANKANYPYGLYYIIEYDDNVVSGIAGSGVVKETWKYNKSGSPTKTKDGGGSSSNNISGKGTIKEYLEADGYRNGVVTVTDKAGNYVTVELETYLDKTTPTIEGKVYKKTSGDSKKDNSVVASATANNTTGDANISTFNSSVNGWLNKANYKTGIYYEFKVTDNLGLDNGKWYYNPDGKKSSDTPAVNNLNGPNTDTFNSVKEKTTHHTLEADGYRKGKYTVIDMAGNPITINTTAPIDKTNPTCKNEGGSTTWLNTLTTEKSRTITGKCSDGMSGCTNGNVSGRTYKDGNVSWTITADTNSTTVSPGTVYDVAGNSTKCEGDRTVKIDMTRPVVSLKVYKKTSSDTKANNTSVKSATGSNASPTVNINSYDHTVNGWLNNANYPNGVYYEFTISDNFGLQKRTWRYNSSGLKSNNASVNTYGTLGSKNFSGKSATNSVTLEAQGYRKGEYIVYDIAGNYVIFNITAPLDRKKPTCTNEGGNSEWINTLSTGVLTRTIKGVCADDMSGCDGANPQKTYSSDIKTTKAGPNGSVKDKAGNEKECPDDQTVKIDRTRPVVSLKVYKKTASDTKANNTSIASATGNNSSPTKNITGTSYTSNVNGWLNKAHYPNGVYYEFTISDNIGLKKRTWRYNSSGLKSNSDSVNTYGSLGSKDLSGKSATNSITLEAEGYRKGEYIVYDEAGNYVTFNIAAPLDRTPPSCSAKDTSKDNAARADGLEYKVSCTDNNKYSSVSTCGGDSNTTKDFNNQTGNRTVEVVDKAGNSGSCYIEVKPQYKASTCNTCKRCDSAACETYESCCQKFEDVTTCSSSNGSRCSKTGVESGYSCSASGGTGNGQTCYSGGFNYYCVKCNTEKNVCTGGYSRTSICNCETREKNCSKCGCSKWNDYPSSWSDTNSCSTSDKNNHKCHYTRRYVLK